MKERYHGWCEKVHTKSEAEKWWKKLSVRSKVEIADELFDFEED